MGVMTESTVESAGLRDALLNASFSGFTGTPIELEDANTRSVFGDYISIYDIQRAVEDKATVPIYYESRLAKLDLPQELKPRIHEEFEEVTEGEEVERKEKLKTKWAQLEAVVGADKRLRLAAGDSWTTSATADLRKPVQHNPSAGLRARAVTRAVARHPRRGSLLPGGAGSFGKAGAR